MEKRLVHCYSRIISVDNLLSAWAEFIKNKRAKKDVQRFAENLMDNIFRLHQELTNFQYRHGGYHAFQICDPKPRQIHKASVKDRLVHHAVYRVLYPFFDRAFVADSYSCRNKKGAHKAVRRFREYFYRASQNNTKSCFCLKMDVKKFFVNINHKVLTTILEESIGDQHLIWLLKNIIGSFQSKGRQRIGLPLGNLTSQLLINIYMDKFDQFVKHRLKENYYIRYADDFIILSDNYFHLANILPLISDFLENRLRLELHENKTFIKTIASGVDFLGFITFADHRILRTKTKRRMLKKICTKNLPSYLGLLKHCNSCQTKQKIRYHFLTKLH